MSFLNYFITPDGLEEFDPETVEKRSAEEGMVIIDVRTRTEYSGGHITNSTNIPLGTVKNHMDKLSKDQKYILICATGHRSRAAGAIFLKNGYHDVAHLKGGMRSWKRSGKNVEK